jgi:predicted naringenin-chalcone synthase
MNAFITSLATATPDRRLSQRYAFDFLESHFSLEPAERDLYRRILLEGPIQTRCIAVDYDEQLCSVDPDEQIARFLDQAVKLAATAARRAMESAPLRAGDVGGLVVNTCTGYLCPGLSSYVAEALGLPRSVKVFDLMGMGCGAAVPNLQCAAGLLPQLTGQSVLSIAVEVCSATLFMGSEPDLVVSNSIFGDGAAACMLSSSHNGSPAIQLIDFETTLLPRYREHLRYRTDGGRLRNTLSRKVPAIGASAISQTVSRLLARRRMQCDQVDFWAVHPGGSAVLDAVQHRIGLPDQALAHSRAVLRDYGNMSSPSVLFVLNEHLSHSDLKAGQKGLLLSFGAGFTAFAALVQIA